MLAKDIIKIKYSQEGYLINYPPHLISDEEMCEAFLTNDISYFYDTYPLRASSLSDNYDVLINAIRYHIARFLSNVNGWKRELPDWVYSYMLGSVVNDSSSQEDRHYLLTGINRDNIEDELDEAAQLRCFEISQNWVNKLDKSLKIVNLNDLLKGYYQKEAYNYNYLIRNHYKYTLWDLTYNYSYAQRHDARFMAATRSKVTGDARSLDADELIRLKFEYDPKGPFIEYTEDELEEIHKELELHNVKFEDNGNILMRPPTMFGEPIIIKSIRLSQVN